MTTVGRETAGRARLKLAVEAYLEANLERPTLRELALALQDEEPTALHVPLNGIPAGCIAIAPSMLPLADLNQQEIDTVAAGVPGGAACCPLNSTA